MSEFEFNTKITKVDASLGLIFGYGIVCKQAGKDYFDLQGDHIPQDVMLAATLDFMKNSNEVRDMHGDEDSKLPGSVVFSFPLTEEIAKAMGIESSTYGWMVAVQPEDSAILEKYQSGEYTGFSIGGYSTSSEEVPENA